MKLENSSKVGVNFTINWNRNMKISKGSFKSFNTGFPVQFTQLKRFEEF